MISRRFFIAGAVVTAPAIIRPGILMSVKRILMPDDGVPLHINLSSVAADLTEASLEQLLMEIKRSYRGIALRPRFLHLT